MEPGKLKKGFTGEECASCAITEESEGIYLRKCSVCKHVSYCSKECQRLHWTKGGHKTFCMPPEARKPSLVQNKDFDSSEDICVICRADPLSNGIKMTLPCGHTYHVQCITKSATLCLSKICPICRSPLPHEFLTTLRLHEEAVNHWNCTVREFKQRTGHNIDCIYNGCHKLSKQNIVALKK